MNVNYDGNEFFKRTEIVKRIFDRQYFFPYHRAKLILIKTWFPEYRILNTDYKIEIMMKQYIFLCSLSHVRCPLYVLLQ